LPRNKIVLERSVVEVRAEACENSTVNELLTEQSDTDRDDPLGRLMRLREKKLAGALNYLDVSSPTWTIPQTPMCQFCEQFLSVAPKPPLFV
jgi:hypothetical protein